MAAAAHTAVVSTHQQAQAAAEAAAAQRERKKRTRNQQQMEHNRLAQQKYRERKKNENQELQTAVELLTAELAAMKALEVHARDMEAQNAMLKQQVGGGTCRLPAALAEELTAQRHG